MAETGKAYILAMRRAWRFNLVLAAVLIAAGCSAVVISLLYRFADTSFFWALPLFASVLFLILKLEKPWSISDGDVSRFLNERFPELEESTQLFLKPQDSLSFLEKIQSSRIEGRFSGLPAIKHRALLTRFAVFLCCLAIATGIWLFPSGKERSQASASPGANHVAINGKPEVLPAKVLSAKISIIPPAYTRKPARDQKEFSLIAETGSQVMWEVETSEPVESLSFIFNDREKVKLRPEDKERTIWRFRKIIKAPGFYQLRINDQLSDLYQLQTIKDQPSYIRIISPKQYTTIDFGEPHLTPVRVSISDDYGIRTALIVATTASGQGEGVKFKEQQLAFPTSFKGNNRSYDLQRVIDLQAMGMTPGDELYFYIKAFDNFNQESRSETYFISIPDTAELMSMEGMSSGVNLVPEYFRSMRQIIIDTEKLIKDRSTISSQDFNNRSNNLGIDQKLLRLRYGKFLGEEGGEEEHDEHADDKPAAFGNTDAILNEYGHNHDNSEDATFFEPELKSQLKATLTEMWNSELRLRVNKPSEALPFEYKALRLLKDLQQKSRAYVAKTSIKTTFLKNETRLSGELDKIINPFNKTKFPAETDPLNALRLMSGVIDKLKNKEKPGGDERRILAEGNQILSNRAIANPSVYLGAVISLRKIMARENYSAQPSELMLIEKALQRAISGNVKIPQSHPAEVASGLSNQYFKNLNHLQQ